MRARKAEKAAEVAPLGTWATEDGGAHTGEGGMRAQRDNNGSLERRRLQAG